VHGSLSAFERHSSILLRFEQFYRAETTFSADMGARFTAFGQWNSCRTKLEVVK
jgi:hypothetical protein